MDNIDIEINEEDTAAVSEEIGALPVNFVPVGSVERESVHVYIRQDVYKRIEKFAREDISREVGSILVGKYVDDGGRLSVIISGYIEARYTDASASTLTFTHETWDDIYKEKDKKYADLSIIGWQHTHPGYGIFLSNYDLFIQENFFNMPWQVAYVVDPIAGTRGFFEWKDKKVAKLTGFYVYDEVGRKISLSREKQKEKKSRPYLTALLIILLFASLTAAVAIGIRNRDIAEKLDQMTAELAEAKKAAVSAAPSPAPVPPPAAEPTAPPFETETFRVYTVEDGDYLEKICGKNGLDYAANIAKIKRINGIRDINMIFTGQKLYLPVE